MGSIIELQDTKISGKSIKTNGSLIDDARITKVGNIAVLSGTNNISISALSSSGMPVGYRPVSSCYIVGVEMTTNTLAYMNIAHNGNIVFTKLSDGTTLTSGSFRGNGCWIVCPDDVDV